MGCAAAHLRPRRLQAGGTWLGVGSGGLFAGLTNRFAGLASPGGIAPDRRSRGLLVLDALEEATAAAAFERLRGLPGELHNPFHLVLADLADAFLLWSDGWEMHAEVLGPGLHVVSERSRGAATSGREDALAGWRPSLSELRPGLAVHRADPMDSTCVHAEAWGYGTRTSTWISYDETGPARFEFTDGPSCVTPWEDLSAAMAEALAPELRRKSTS